MTGPARIRVLIVDDHPIVRAGIRGMLADQEDLDVVGEAATGAEAVALAASLHPDVALMDLRMPEMDGVTATAEIVRAHPRTRVVVLTTYETDGDILRAIEAGATGYLLKDTPRDALFAAIRTAARGESVLSPAVATRVVGRLRAMGEEALSAREIDVLSRVARGESNKEIARGLHLSEATVKSHLLNIYGKLGVADRTAAAVAALERGILRPNR